MHPTPTPTLVYPHPNLSLWKFRYWHICLTQPQSVLQTTGLADENSVPDPNEKGNMGIYA